MFMFSLHKSKKMMLSSQKFNLSRKCHLFGRNIGATRSNRPGPSPTSHYFDAEVQPVNAAAVAVSFFPCQATLQRHLPGATSCRWKGGRFLADIGKWGEKKYQWGSASNIVQNLPLSSRWMSSRQGIDFRDCNSLGGMIEMANNNLEVLSARDISAFWTLVPKLLRRGSHRLLEDNPNASNQLDSILVHTLECMGSFSYRDLTQTTLGMAKIVKQIGNKGRGIHRGNPLQPLQELFGREVHSDNTQFIFNHIAATSMPILSEFDERHLSNFIYAFGLVEHDLKFGDGSPFFGILADEVLVRLEKFDARYLSNILWAYANAKASNHNLFQKAGETIIGHGLLKSFNSQDISNTVWAYATAEQQHPGLFKKLGDHIQAMESLQGFNEQNLANTLWAYATLNESHPKLFNKVSDHITSLDNLERFKPQTLSNTVWAYAKAECESNPQLFKKVADHITALINLDKFIPQALSNTVWAYATADESNPKVFKKVADHVITLDSLERFSGQDISNTVWAYATANESNPKLFQKVADHIIELSSLEKFTPQNLSNTVWAYATANESHPKLFNKVAHHVIALENLERFKPQALSNIIWAYAKANESSPKLFKKFADHIVALNNLERFNPQNLVNIIWAHATANESNPKLFDKVADHIGARNDLERFNEQDLANVAWSFSVANVAAPSLFNYDFIHACLEKEAKFSLEEQLQLYQWQLWQDELKTNLRLPQSLESKCYNAFISQVPTPSNLQNDVISELRSIGLNPEEEKLTKRGYRLDAYVEINDEKIGIEVDGPSHFLSRKPTGSTLLKRRQIDNLDGVRIVSVPYWEWNKFRKDSKKKQRYLRQLLGLN